MKKTRDTEVFVPPGASRLWPFVIAANVASLRSRWRAQLLLGRSLVEALLHIQPTESRENWRKMRRDTLAILKREGGAGAKHPSRTFVAGLIREGESVLDVGCGEGVGYESLATFGLEAKYVGIDSSEPSIEIAREFYPEGDFRIGSATSLVSNFGASTFDIVLVRHVLEHLPDFETAMNEAIAVSGRLAVFIFFLTPRALPLGVRKVDLGFNWPVFYTYVYSRRAINHFLGRCGLHWRWFENLGISRAGWFADEVNCALVVSRDQSELVQLES